MEIYESNRIRLKQLVKSCKEKNQDITAEQIKTEMLASNIYISPNEP